MEEELREVTEGELRELEEKYVGHADMLWEGEKNRVILRLIDEIRRLRGWSLDDSPPTP